MPSYIVTKNTYEQEIKAGKLVELKDSSGESDSPVIAFVGIITGVPQQAKKNHAKYAAEAAEKERLNPKSEGLVIRTEMMNGKEVVVEKYEGAFNKDGLLEVDKTTRYTISEKHVDADIRNYKGLATLDPKKLNPEEMLAVIKTSLKEKLYPKVPQNVENSGYYIASPYNPNPTVPSGLSQSAPTGNPKTNFR